MARKPTTSTEQKIARAYQDMWESPVGRKVLSHLLFRCHVFQTPYAPTDRDTNFQLGEQNIGVMIATYLAWKPDDVIDRHQQAMDAMMPWHIEAH